MREERGDRGSNKRGKRKERGGSNRVERVRERRKSVCCNVFLITYLIIR